MKFRKNDTKQGQPLPHISVSVNNYILIRKNWEKRRWGASRGDMGEMGRAPLLHPPPRSAPVYTI